MKRQLTPFNAAVSLIVGLAMPALAIHMMIPMLWTLRYQSTHGTVVSSEMKSLGQRPETLRYQPQIEFQYVVAGDAYIGRTYTVASLHKSGTIEWAADVVAQYPPGGQCTVYFDPDRPAVSVLERSPRAGFVIFLVLFSSFGLFIAVMCMLWLKRYYAWRRADSHASGKDIETAK
jgi:hypothetical protein